MPRAGISQELDFACYQVQIYFYELKNVSAFEMAIFRSCFGVAVAGLLAGKLLPYSVAQRLQNCAMKRKIDGIES